MRFLFFTDTHIRGNTPRNRKDDFYETLKIKFNELKELADTLEVDYILHGGDWFDRPDISPSVVREFAMLIKNFRRPIYTIPGNHDIFGHNPETIGRTMLGILESIDLMTLLKYEDILYIEKDGVRVQLTGKAYHYGMDGEEFRSYYIIKKEKDVDFAINMVHGMLLAKPFFEGIQYTLLEDIRETEADITLAGHYHSGFGVMQLPGAGGGSPRYFINPGSLVRVTNTLSEMERRPKAVYIELTDKIHIEEIELKSARPGEEVLDRTQLERNQDRTKRLQEFYQGVAATSHYTKMDMHQIIEEIASNDALSEEVKEEALRRIAIARENIS